MPERLATTLASALALTQPLPYLPLSSLPTPVERLTRAGDALGIDQLYIKRDDQSGALYGGNKVRKLDFLLGEARALGKQAVITLGAIGSNHVLATSLYARAHGFEPMAQQYPQPLNAHVLDNLRALSTTQPTLRLLAHPVEAPFRLFQDRLRAWMTHHPEAYYIPAGGSSALGALGYVEAAFELRAQIDRGELPEPDVIIVTAGTCGTLAGLLLGARLAGLKAQIIGARVVDRVVTNSATTAHLANQSAALLARHGARGMPKLRRGDVTIWQDTFGEAYGEPTDEARAAIAMMADGHGLRLDGTYTGKTFSGIMTHRDALRAKVVLYWHTLSGVDLGPLTTSANIQRDLPPAYHPFFDQEVSA